MKKANMKCVLNREYLPANSERGETVFLAVEITPIGGATTMATPNVSLLIDSSGSMAGEKIDTAKKSAKKFIESLDNVDYTSVITFNSEVKVVAAGSGKTRTGMVKKGGLLDKLTRKITPIGDKSVMLSKISQIDVHGGTDLYSALQEGYKAIESSKPPSGESVDRIILLSDGDPTVGATSEKEFAKLAKDIGSLGISIVACGIGGGLGGVYNEDLLMTLSENSRRGKWRHVKTADDMVNLFEEEATKIKTITMIKPYISIKVAKGAEIGKIYQAEPEVQECKDVQKAETNYTFPAGDVVAGETQSFVVEFHLPSRPEGQCRIAEVNITSGETKDVVVQYTSDANLYSRENNNYPRHLFIISETSILGKTALAGDKTTLKQATQRINTVIKDPDATAHIRERAIEINRLISEKPTEVLTDEERKKKKEGLTTVIKR